MLSCVLWEFHVIHFDHILSPPPVFPDPPSYSCPPNFMLFLFFQMDMEFDLCWLASYPWGGVLTQCSGDVYPVLFHWRRLSPSRSYQSQMTSWLRWVFTSMSPPSPFCWGCVWFQLVRSYCPPLCYVWFQLVRSTPPPLLLCLVSASQDLAVSLCGFKCASTLLCLETAISPLALRIFLSHFLRGFMSLEGPLYIPEICSRMPSKFLETVCHFWCYFDIC